MDLEIIKKNSLSTIFHQNITHSTTGFSTKLSFSQLVLVSPPKSSLCTRKQNFVCFLPMDQLSAKMFLIFTKCWLQYLFSENNIYFHFFIK